MQQTMLQFCDSFCLKVNAACGRMYCGVLESEISEALYMSRKYFFGGLL